jgi:hypothetical protein
MHNIWPVGQMWPAKALNSAREAQNLVDLTCLCHKNISVLALEVAIFGPPKEFSRAPLI